MQNLLVLLLSKINKYIFLKKLFWSVLNTDSCSEVSLLRCLWLRPNRFDSFCLIYMTQSIVGWHPLISAFFSEVEMITEQAKEIAVTNPYV